MVFKVQTIVYWVNKVHSSFYNESAYKKALLMKGDLMNG